MTHQVTILAIAQRDADQIFAWLRKRSIAGAERWYHAFVAAVQSLHDDPTRHTRAPEASRRRDDLYQCFFKTQRGRKYRLVFVVDGESVVVLRVRGPGQAPLKSQRDR